MPVFEQRFRFRSEAHDALRHITTSHSHCLNPVGAVTKNVEIRRHGNLSLIRAGSGTPEHHLLSEIRSVSCSFRFFMRIPRVRARRSATYHSAGSKPPATGSAGALLPGNNEPAAFQTMVVPVARLLLRSSFFFRRRPFLPSFAGLSPILVRITLLSGNKIRKDPFYRRIP